MLKEKITLIIAARRFLVFIPMEEYYAIYREQANA